MNQVIASLNSLASVDNISQGLNSEQGWGIALLVIAGVILIVSCIRTCIKSLKFLIPFLLLLAGGLYLTIYGSTI